MSGGTAEASFDASGAFKFDERAVNTAVLLKFQLAGVINCQVLTVSVRVAGVPKLGKACEVNPQFFG